MRKAWLVGAAVVGVACVVGAAGIAGIDSVVSADAARQRGNVSMVIDGVNEVSDLNAKTARTGALLEEQARKSHTHADYLRDRDLVRKAKPKTEAEIAKLIGRSADGIIDYPESPVMRPMTILQWFYPADAPPGRDLIQIAVRDGTIFQTTL